MSEGVCNLELIVLETAVVVEPCSTFGFMNVCLYTKSL